MRFGAPFSICLALCATVLWAAGAMAQQPIQIIEPVQVGINGVLQRGTWTPLRLRVRNNTSKPRTVVCQWILSDHDGDVAHYQRKVTLGGNTEQGVWLCAPVPIGTGSDTRWRLVVADAPVRDDTGDGTGDDQPGEVLASLVIRPPFDEGAVMGLDTRLVGITGSYGLGLDVNGIGELEGVGMQHELTQLILGLDPANLPDQWQGLTMLHAIVWTPRGPDPGSASVSLPTQAAIQEWIRRGGHFVVVMPSFGNPWLDSFLGDAFPPVTVGTLPDQTLLPEWIGPNTPLNYRADFRTFTPRPGTPPSQVAVLKRHQGEPVVVTSLYGFGRVTLIGVDVSDPQLVNVGLPNLQDMYERGLWGAVFGWRSPAWSSTRIRSEKEKNNIVGWGSTPVVLDEFISQRIDRKSVV